MDSMRVVSQDKKLSFEFESCEIWLQNESIYKNHYGDNERIGLYGDEDKAQRVFDSMHKAYGTGKIAVYYMPEN